ncbi:MAG TPA: hypothetical protein VFG86_02675 [Chloroflexota bacterium]|nr:hypothetical protein [Chloroflexota bacterium]
MLEAMVRRKRFRARRSRVPLTAFVIGLLYFIWVALLATNVIALPGLEHYISVQDWAVFGAVLMILLLVVLVVWSSRSRDRVEEVYEAPATRGAQPSWEADELVVTAEAWKGLRVLEYSRPPKSDAPAAVYTKCYVPLDGQFVLRVEDRIAEARA